jgi:hypothetical protein
MTIGFLSTFALIAALVPLANCQAASNGSWDGTWSGRALDRSSAGFERLKPAMHHRPVAI